MNYQKDAAKALATVRAIGASIPGYKSSVSAEEMRSLVRHATVPGAFIELTAVAVEASPELTRTGIFDPDEGRDARDFNVYCRTVADELEIVARGIRYAGLRRLASAGDAALRTLAIAKTFNRRGMVVRHVAAMQRALRPRRRKAAKRVADKSQQPSANRSKP